MKTFKQYIVLLLLINVGYAYAQKQVTIYGNIVNQDNLEAIDKASIKILNSSYGTTSKADGHFSISIPYKKRISLLVSCLGYQKIIKEIVFTEKQDSMYLPINLTIASLDTISIFASLKPDTLVGSPKFSIYDFDFYEDSYILLTAEKSLEKAYIKLANPTGSIITSYQIPKEAGEAKEFYKDYMGFTNIICKNIIYRISVYHQRFILMPLAVDDVTNYIKPVLDTINGQLIFTDFNANYPLFNYYSYNEKDSTKKLVYTVEDAALMHSYNFEYYSLPPKHKVEAQKLANSLNADKHVVAAMMTGFTKSMFYTPLFAPLYIISDTITVFDHYKNSLYHFNKKGEKIDSIIISYHHPKNWKEWENNMLKDDIENKIYAVYDKNGHKYIKGINYRNGKDQGKYTIQFHSATKLKIHDGYIYYIYRPFESTQEKFFYRELIRLE